MLTTGECIGFIGLEHVDFVAHFTPAIEIGWRLGFDHWGKGYATEGAKAALQYGFETLKLEEIVSFTAKTNLRSQNVMKKIGMHHDPKEDFDHPKLPDGHPLQRHVLYRLKLPKKKYVFKPYSLIFPELFEREKTRISSQLKMGHHIEHIGSTAIPGMGGKGIIDIAIAVQKEDMQTSSDLLQDLGYEFRSNFSTSDRFYFVGNLEDPEEGTRRYHIHLTYLENPEWKKLIQFRDYLKCHPNEAQEYAEIKKKAAKEANQDGIKYREMKETIIQRIGKK